MKQHRNNRAARYWKAFASLSLAAALAACSPGQPETSLAERAGAPLFEGMGDFHRDITTSDPDAQKDFDQGMVLAFGFNHAESIRSFRAAPRRRSTHHAQCASGAKRWPPDPTSTSRPTARR